MGKAKRLKPITQADIREEITKRPIRLQEMTAEIDYFIHRKMQDDKSMVRDNVLGTGRNNRVRALAILHEIKDRLYSYNHVLICTQRHKVVL